MKIWIELLSDLCVSTGESYNSYIDTDVVYDDYGMPYIPGKRIKGCIREAALELVEFGVASKEAYDNTISQMKELIIQNYNHPSVVVWGIANEITIVSKSEELYQNLCDLNSLAKKIDPSRPTAIAHSNMEPIASKYNHITDVVNYNKIGRAHV